MPNITTSELVALLVFVVAMFSMIKFGTLKFWHFLLVFAAAFYLADYTPAGGQVASIVDSIRTAIGH